MHSALVCLLFVICFSAASAQQKNRWVLVSVPQNGPAIVMHHKPTHHELEYIKNAPHPADSEWWVRYRSTHGSWEHLSLPRASFAEHYDSMDENLKMSGSKKYLPTMEVSFVLPPHVQDFDVHHVMTNRSHALSVRHRGHHAHVLESSINGGKYLSDIAVVTGQTTRQFNIVFLASGYTDEAKFRSDVETSTQFLQVGYQDLQNPLSSMPYKRYFTGLNIFAVYQKSAEAGASKPGRGVSVDNNLGCSYGRDVERQLTCTRALVLSLASLAPAHDLTVVLVNDNLYGGTGGSGVAHVYTGQYQPHVILHEIGHAVAGVSDEYDYGFNEPDKQSIPNCHYSMTQDVPWQKWIDQRVLGYPKPVCGYTNYYKSEGSCIMEGVFPGYCRVCSEAVVKELYKKNFDILAPRCPVPGEIVTLVRKETFDVYVGRLLAMTQQALDNTGIFNASFRVGTAPWTPITSIPFTIDTTDLAVGSHQVQFIVEDRTNLVATQLPNMRQESSFTIHLVETEAERAASNCSTDINTHCKSMYATPYCRKCQDGFNCTIDLSIRPLQLTASNYGAAGVFSKYPYMIVGFLCTALILVFFTMMLSNYSRSTVQRLVNLSPSARMYRYTVMVTSAVVLFMAVLGLIVCAVMYARYSLYGKSLIMSAVIYCAGVFFVAYLVLASAYLKQPLVLNIGATALGLSFIVTTFIVVWAFTAYVQQDDFLMPVLSEEWLTRVRDEPSMVCSFQEEFECSGFNNSCLANPKSAYCPENCEIANQNANPCWFKAKDEVLIYFLYAGVCLCAVNVAIVVVIVLSCLLARNIRAAVKRFASDRMSKSRELIHLTLSLSDLRYVKERFHRLDSDGDGYLETGEIFEFLTNEMPHVDDELMMTLLRDFDDEHDGRIDESEFLAMYCTMIGKNVPHNIGDLTVIDDDSIQDLWRQFCKVDKDRSGTLDRMEFREFYEAVMGESVTPACVDDLFSQLDMDGNGVLTFREFLLIYNPHVQFRHFSNRGAPGAPTYHQQGPQVVPVYASGGGAGPGAASGSGEAIMMSEDKSSHVSSRHSYHEDQNLDFAKEGSENDVFD
eukprot:PhM_4_TR6978/c0_g1_i1/m.6561